MSNSDQSNNSALLYKVLLNGVELSEDTEIISIRIRKQFCKIPSAEVTFYYGNLSNSTFIDENDDKLDVGTEIEILATDDELTLFKGIVVKKGISLSSRRSYLTLTAKNKAFKMTQSRMNHVFSEMKDSEIIEDLIGKYGIDCDVEATTYQNESVTQYNCTDWDFVNMKAEANGMLVLVGDEGIKVGNPTTGDAKLEINGYDSIIDFDAQLDGTTAYTEYKAKAWNYNTQEPQEVEQKNSSSDFSQGKQQTKDIAEKLESDAFNMNFNGSFVDEDVITAKLNATIMRNNLARVIGKVKLYGVNEVSPGECVQFSGIGESFNGIAFATEATYEFKNGAWYTTIGFGLEDTSYYWTYDDINAAPASELLPAAHGLQMGKVVALEGDPMDDFRIKVELPCFDGDNAEVWARLTCADAGDKRGFYFVPEIGDEVVIGFVDQNPSNPIVLGTLHSNKIPAPQEHSDDNNVKGLYLKSGIKLEFNEEDKIVTLETPGGNSLHLNDKDGKIEIADSNGNQITLDNQGITIKSAGKVAIEATQDMNLKGVNLTAEASAQLKASGNAQAEVSSSGVMVVKGSLVQIN